MAEDLINAQTAQSGDLAENAVSNANVSQQARVAVQSSGEEYTEREKQLLQRAFRDAQSLVSKSENRQQSQFQGMIDKFKAETGVTLTEEQAREMAANQFAKSMPNASAQGQGQAQQATQQNDPSYQGFLYYHGIQDAPVFREAFNIQQMLGVKLDESDEEYKQYFVGREEKYQPADFLEAWKQACVGKMMRLKAMQEGNQGKANTNLGQMPLVGSKGNTSEAYDPARTAKSYISEYLKDLKV